MTQHSKTPFKAVGGELWSESGKLLYKVGGSYTEKDAEKRRATLAFIVTACNSHEALVAALESAKDALENPDEELWAIETLHNLITAALDAAREEK